MRSMVDGSAMDGELVLNSQLDQKGSADCNTCESGGEDNFHVDLNEFDHHESNSQPANMMQKHMESSYGNSNSHMQARNCGYHGDKQEGDLQDKSFSHGVIFHGNGRNEVEDALHLQDFPFRADANDKHRLNLKASPETGRLTPPSHDENACRFHSDSLKGELRDRSYQELEGHATSVQIGKLSSSPSPSLGANGSEVENLNQLTESPGEEANMNVPDSGQHSPWRVPRGPSSPSMFRQKSVLPVKSDGTRLSARGGKSSSLHHVDHDELHSPESHKGKYSSPTKGSGLEKQLSSCGHLFPAKETSASPKQSSQWRDIPLRPGFASPRTHRCGRKDRSRSRSPVRQRDSSLRYYRGYHDRPRSRSPYSRNLHRSRSRSPVRPRDSSLRYVRAYHDRPRSGSPYSRNLNKRTARYSPRRRSPSRHVVRCRSPRKRPWSPPPNRSTGLGKPGRHLFVAGFEFLTTERDLERKFSQFGHVRDVRIIRDKRSGDSRGFAFLSMESDAEADAAIRALDETKWNGRVILVEKSKTPGR